MCVCVFAFVCTHATIYHTLLYMYMHHFTLFLQHIQLRRDRFLLELEGYEKQLQELDTFGDLQEVKRYLKKAQALNARLEEAAERIEGFNIEEDAFEWDRSQYPQRSKLVKTLDPYFNLYKTVVDFQNKHE